MVVVKPELAPGQLPRPVVWTAGPMELPRVPVCDDATLERVFGPGRRRIFRSWGHTASGAHWLATRGGLPLHTDKAYARYTHHLVLRNDGWRLPGVDDDVDQHPMLVPGTLLCLDTHSPHRLARDPRFGAAAIKVALYKVAVAVDRDKVLTPRQVWVMLAPWLERASVVEGFAGWAGRAPASPVR